MKRVVPSLLFALLLDSVSALALLGYALLFAALMGMRDYSLDWRFIAIVSFALYPIWVLIAYLSIVTIGNNK